MPTKAGKGEHHVYRILPKQLTDQKKLTAGEHYIGVDAVAWFINKESSWFTERMASGTLEIKLSGGLEKYQAALGTFELKSGAKVAPVFERPVLPDRNYVGGSITLVASLAAIKKNTAVGGMLKSAANASLGIVAGMVQTATLSGPVQLLMAAGNDLIRGVKEVLSDTAKKREPLFDFSGLEFNIRPKSVVSQHIFLLFHRGAKLNEKNLTVQTSGQLLLPFLRDSVLDDGAWILLRLRRSDEYSGVRDWYKTAKRLRGKIATLVMDVEADVISKQEALKRLKPSTTGDTTLFDDFAKLRTIILNDGVLSEREAKLHVGQLNATFVAARKAINEHNMQVFHDGVKELRTSLVKGQPPRTPVGRAVGRAFVNEVGSFSNARQLLERKRKRVPAAARPSASDVFSEMRFLPKAVRASSRFPKS